MSEQPVIKAAATKLPKELHYNMERAKKLETFLEFLNQEPPKSWVKKHPYANNLYIPIDKVEYLLNSIYQDWSRDIISYQLLLNSICVHVKLRVLNPITGEWTSHDGVGAQPLQLDAKSSPMELTALKLSAVQMALPMAASYAVKDAAENLGKIFGRDLSRKDTLEFKETYGKPEKQVPADTEAARVMKMIDAAISLDVLKKCEDHLSNTELRAAYDKKYKLLKK